MADTLDLDIVTPERLVVREKVEQVQIPGKNGYLGILPGHAPLVTELGVGELSYVANGQTYRLAVAWGFAEVLPTKTTVLAESAERGEDIDVARAQQARDRAQKLLSSNDPDTDYPRALDALARAQSRLDVAAKASQRAAA